jgi:GLPGLI family protein
MKKCFYFYVISVFLLGMNQLKAQSSERDILKISYVTNPASPQMLSILKEQIPSSEQYQGMVKKITNYKFYYSLYVNLKTQESLYILDSVHKESNVHPAGNLAFVFTDDSGHVTGNEKFTNSTHSFYGEMKDIEWVFTEEEKEINGYVCKNATIKDHSSISVWFTSDISVNRGPGYYQGLLGLPLECVDAFESTTAAHVEYLSNKNNLFSELVKSHYNEETQNNRISVKELLFLKDNVFNSLKNKAMSK